MALSSPTTLQPQGRLHADTRVLPRVAHPDWEASGQVHRAFCDVCEGSNPADGRWHVVVGWWGKAESRLRRADSVAASLSRHGGGPWRRKAASRSRDTWRGFFGPNRDSRAPVQAHCATFASHKPHKSGPSTTPLKTRRDSARQSPEKARGADRSSPRWKPGVRSSLPASWIASAAKHG